MNAEGEVKNRLALEASPYLRQHQGNPVDWYPWGREALALAKEGGKPILLSIGYSACHWCHVMAHESFEDPSIAALMNEHFICVKVDREERPDLDEIYMTAVQMLSRRGGWPLTVFLTPDLHPFFGGTYFPPEGRYGQPGFPDVLRAVSSYYQERRAEAESTGGEIARALSLSGHTASLKEAERLFEDRSLSVAKLADALAPSYQELLETLSSDVDRTHGGFGGAPKFPQPSKIAALLGSPVQAQRALAFLTLDKIRCGGITDQLGGGVARYSVDSRWLVPHFEKMLYDNAQLLPLYARASVLVDEPELSAAFAAMAHSIFNYLESDLRHPASGLYMSAEDADSEGEEGRFYVFQKTEVDSSFASDPHLGRFALAYFQITASGNFEGANILTVPERVSTFAKAIGKTVAEVEGMAAAARALLLEARVKRVRPGVDDKCLLAWNALAATGLLRAARALDDARMQERGLDLVLKSASFFVAPEGVMHQWCQGEAKIAAFADDVAFLLEAACEALLATGSPRFLILARRLVKHLWNEFVDVRQGSFYYAAASPELIARPHKPEDNVIQSPHAAAVFGAQSILAWLDAQGRGDQLPQEERALFEALSLTAYAGVAALAREMPLAVPQSLQLVPWLRSRGVLLVDATQTGGMQQSCALTAEPTRALLQAGRGEVLVGRRLAPAEGVAPAAKTQFSYCDARGCLRPAGDLQNLLRELEKGA